MHQLADHLNPPEAHQILPRTRPRSVAAPAGAPKPRRAWVPVRSLTTRHRDRVKAHLLALDEHARYLRFGFAASDVQINHYADSLEFERDEVFGIFNRRLELIGMAHLAYASTPQIAGKPAMAEFGVSVLSRSRGRGFGARLFDHAILHARNRHIDTLFVYALSENTAMLRIALNAGAKVVRDGPESEALLCLPPDDLASQVGAVMEEQAAEWDYRMKENAKLMCQFMGVMAEVKTDIDSAVSSTRGDQH